MLHCNDDCETDDIAKPMYFGTLNLTAIV